MPYKAKLSCVSVQKDTLLAREQHNKNVHYNMQDRSKIHR